MNTFFSDNMARKLFPREDRIFVAWLTKHRVFYSNNSNNWILDITPFRFQGHPYSFEQSQNKLRYEETTLDVYCKF